uniref:GADD45B n=1 Tax=Bos mutus grunniens TaxID=30521 RepID=A0A8B9WB52_BOSMU
MTLEELVACDNAAQKMQTVSAAVEELLVAAQLQDRLTVGVYESAKLMNGSRQRGPVPSGHRRGRGGRHRPADPLHAYSVLLLRKRHRHRAGVGDAALGAATGRAGRDPGHHRGPGPALSPGHEPSHRHLEKPRPGGGGQLLRRK